MNMHVDRTMLRFDKGDTRFNCRSAAVIIEEGHVLLHQVVGDDFWALPGGRVEFFEFSSDTVGRELLEELGLHVEVVRPLWIVENFFTFEGTHFHELGHYFLTKVRASKPFDFEREFMGVEADVNLLFKWFNVDHLQGVELQPKFLRLGLANIPEHLCHELVNELDPALGGAPAQAACASSSPRVATGDKLH